MATFSASTAKTGDDLDVNELIDLVESLAAKTGSNSHSSIVSTSSTTFADVDSTNQKVQIAVSSDELVIVKSTLKLSNNDTTKSVILTHKVDGTDSTEHIYYTSDANDTSGDRDTLTFSTTWENLSGTIDIYTRWKFEATPASSVYSASGTLNVILLKKG